MVKEYFCLADVIGLQMPPDTTIKLPGFTISNETEFLINNFIIDLENFILKFGTIDAMGLDKRRCFVIISTDGSDVGFIHFSNNRIAGFLSELWNIKDNSIFVSNFFYIPSNSADRYFISRMNFFNYDSQGRSVITHFSHDDLNLALKNRKTRSTYFVEKNDFIEATVDSITTSSGLGSNYNSLSRLERANLFLLNARKLSIIPIRITNYIIYLECLFSTSSIQVTQRVSERASLFLNKYDKSVLAIDLYKFIKECYDIRSKYIHGSELKNKYDTQQKLHEYSQRLDEVCRSIDNAILKNKLTIFNSDKNSLEKYLSEFVFS